MNFNEDEIRCILFVAKCFCENRDFISRDEAIKELGVEDVTYDTLIKIMKHHGVVGDVKSVTGKNGYAVFFRPLAYAEKLAREIKDEKPGPKQTDSDIVELLRREHLLESRHELTQKTAKIAQDFVSRGSVSYTHLTLPTN